MARTLRDSKLDTREARKQLKVRGRPYWRLIEPGLHLGYRRLGGRPGTWSVRRYVGAQSYTLETLKGVVADDYADADATTVLSFAQAQKVALRRKPKAAAGPLTVKNAVEQYLAHRSSSHDARVRAEAFIYPKLGDVRVEALTSEQLRTWLAALAKTPPRVRTGKGQPLKHNKKFDASDEEWRRKRMATVNRILTILKAALNHAFREGRVASDIEWRRVKAFKNAEAARIRYLTVAEAQRLVNASQGGFRRLVQGALATGCRYSELARLTVGDFNPEAGSLLVYRSKSGKPRHVLLTDEAAALFVQWCAGGDGQIFCNERGKPWTPSMQGPPMREACRRASITGASFHALRHTWASLSVMAGMPLMVVARNLGHRDTRMVELHYGHLAPGYVRDAIREGAPKFGFKPDRVVTPLRG